MGKISSKGLSTEKLLTEEQTRELIRRAQKGDKTAINKLVEANIGLIGYCAKSLFKFVHDGIELHDLNSEGYFGLIKAIKKYDLESETKFSTYATCCIIHNIRRSIGQTRSTIRFPEYATRALSLIRKAREKFAVEFGHEPSKEELAKIVDLPMNVFNYFVNRKYVKVSLNRLMETEEWDIYDETQDLELPGDNLGELKKIIDGIKGLGARDKEILYLRLGLVDGKNWTLDMCGEKFKISRQAIAGIERRTLRNIRISPQVFQLAKYVDNPEAALLRLEENFSVNNDKVAFELNRFISDEKNDFLRRRIVKLLKTILKNSIPTKAFSLKMGYLDGIEHSDAEIAEALGITEEEVYTLNQKVLEKIKRSENCYKLTDLDSRILPMINKPVNIKNIETIKRIRELIRIVLKGTVSVRIFMLKTGYADGTKYSDLEIANMLGLSEEEVHRIYEKSMARIINSRQYSELVYLEQTLLVNANENDKKIK